MSTLPAPVRLRNAVALTALANLFLGFPVYFVAFLVAYAFRDRIAPADHAFFLAEIGAFVVIISLLAMVLVRGTTGSSPQRAFLFALWVSSAMNLVALGLGSMVSAMNAHQGSVTAEYSLTTDVVIAAAFLLPAVGAGWLGVRARPL